MRDGREEGRGGREGGGEGREGTRKRGEGGEGGKEGVGKSLFTSIVATHCWEILAILCPPLPCPVPTAWWTRTADSSLKRDLWSMREREKGVRSRGREGEREKRWKRWSNRGTGRGMGEPEEGREYWKKGGRGEGGTG